MTRTVLPIEGKPRGLLFPANGRGLKREDLAAIPDDATLALAVRLNVQKTLDALAAAGKKADPEIKRVALRRDWRRSSAAATPTPGRISLPRWATVGASTTRRARADW